MTTENLEARVWRAERELTALTERYRIEVVEPYRRGREDEKREHEALRAEILALRERFKLENAEGNYGLLTPIAARLSEADTYERLYERLSDELRDARDANALLRAAPPETPKGGE